MSLSTYQCPEWLQQKAIEEYSAEHPAPFVNPDQSPYGYVIYEPKDHKQSGVETNIQVTLLLRRNPDIRIRDNNVWMFDNAQIMLPKNIRPSKRVKLPAQKPGRTGIVNALPAARALAQENGIDIATVTGTGKGGYIGVKDVKAAIANKDIGNAA